MITAELARKIDLLPQESYNKVESFIEHNYFIYRIFVDMILIPEIFTGKKILRISCSELLLHHRILLIIGVRKDEVASNVGQNRVICCNTLLLLMNWRMCCIVTLIS